ncbi:MAG TPA: response regulator transcription factor [Streptosporangiaceae bacterium]|nr:response regulator transcription factor [Streptosporangiaceae bacterium]
MIRSGSSSAGLPYAPFTAALRELICERGATEVAALLPGPGSGELAALLPEFGVPPSAADPQTARARLFELPRRAAGLATQLAAGSLRQQISQLARRARIRLDGTGSEPGEGTVPFGLTAREQEVLRLVAAGRGNREIAAELFISHRTASVHVSNILGKLQVASRGEAAAMAYRLHLFDPS